MTAETTPTPELGLMYGHIGSSINESSGNFSVNTEPRIKLSATYSSTLKTSPDQPSNEAESIGSIVEARPPSWVEMVSQAEERLREPVGEALDEDGQKPTDATIPPSWVEMVSQAEERLREPVDEALDEDGQKPTDAAMVGACVMLDIAGDLIEGHDVETYATSSCDVITDVTDYRNNYVVFKNKAGGEVAVHYNINGYKEFAIQGDVDKGFVRSMLSALQRNLATP